MDKSADQIIYDASRKLKRSEKRKFNNKLLEEIYQSIRPSNNRLK
tara:strand:- start:582 stop:716 length:135 start_codon:yes stop_codon:yes gene_type:complete